MNDFYFSLVFLHNLVHSHLESDYKTDLSDQYCMKLLTLMFALPAFAFFSCNQEHKSPACHIPDYSYNAGIEDTTAIINDTARKLSLSQTSVKTRNSLVQAYIHSNQSPREKIAESSVSSGLRQSMAQELGVIFRILSKTGNKQ